MRLFVVTAFLGQAPHAAFARSDWPWHVTVSGNFTSAHAVTDLRESLGEGLRSVDALPVETGEAAAFGDDGAVGVVLVEPADVWKALHDRVARVLTGAGCAFTTPFVGDDYRAHVTDVRGVSWSGTATVSSLHLVRLDGALATVRAELLLSAPLTSP